MLVEVDDIREYLKIENSRVDSFLEIALQEAQSLLDEDYGRTFESSLVTFNFSGNGCDSVVLKNRPVISVTSVYTDVDSAALASTDYAIFEERGVIQLRYATFPAGIKNCRVVYTAGYTAVTCPKIIKLAIKQLAAIIYKDSWAGDGSLNKQSVNMENGGTTNYLHQLPAATLRGMSRFRNLSV